MRSLKTESQGRDRKDCTKQFKAARDRFAEDEANLTEFLNARAQAALSAGLAP
jgi:hypothetical protein